MYFTWILMMLCVGISHGQRIPEQSSQDQEMHLYCTNRDQHSVRTGHRIKQGKAGPAGPPGVVNYKIVNETIKEHFNYISGQIQVKLTQIGRVVEQSSEDIEDLKAASGHTQTKLNGIETDIKGLKSDISGQIQAKLTEIGPIVEKSSEDIEDLKAASGRTQTKLNGIETAVEGLTSVIQQIREQLGNLTRTLALHGIEDISTWYQARNNYYYKIFYDRSTYAEAKANCKRYGGQLASAGYRDEDVRREILPLVKSERYDTWIGLNDIQEENTFTWEDGIRATAGSTPWHGGQPNNWNGDQDCVEMVESFDWELNDEDCTYANKYLCEIEP
uniref:collectin-10-like isoform X1 n=1 Tax=Styela clava TaxID=7725 RepID=UPI00193A0528|nr:collectin-10-like isoform X1 [Styela clava]